jgi:2,3-bisphosphoglycerate-dependent phosphoglycerate mutase
MTTKIAPLAALIRHGQYHQPENVPSAELPYGLDDAGRAQSREGAELLAGAIREAGLEPHSVIDSSDLRRAWETAGIFKQVFDAEFGRSFSVQSVGALRERSVGSAANLTVDEIARIVEDDPRYQSLPEGWKRDPAFRLPFPGAESLLEAGARVEKHLRHGMAEVAPGMIRLFVGHGGAFRHAAHHLGVLDSADVHRLSMYYGRPVCLAAGEPEWSHTWGDWKARHGAKLD